MQPTGSVVDSARPGDAQASSSQSPVLRDGLAIRRVLVCLDRSQSAEACLPHAIAVSKTLGSATVLLYVMKPRQEHSTDAVAWEISRQEALAYLERLQRDVALSSGHPVEIRVEQGHPAERITAVAREFGADLIVLASHGERGVTAWHLGSTVQQVLAVARSSVFVVPSSSRAAAVVAPKRILVPLDGSLRTESALPTASRIASAYGAELLLAVVVPDPLPNALLRAPEDLELARELATRLEARARRYVEQLRARLGRDGATIRTLVARHADVRQSLLEIAEAEQSDLIVLSAHGSTCNAALPFGSVAAHLLAHSAVPLLVLQDLRGDVAFEHLAGAATAPKLRASYPPEDA